MKKLLISLLVLASFGFSANWTNMKVDGKATRTIPLALGASVTNTLTGTSSITLDVIATTGRTSLGQIQTLSNQGVAISTVDVVVLTDMVIGDIVLFQTERASEDVVFVDDNSTILLGGATRTLSDPADVLGLQKISATAVREIIFVDNK
jgi:hypothetical protein